MKRKDVIRKVLQAADEFNGRRLWKRFTNFDCFAVRIPDRDEMMLGVILGDAGEEYGLTLFRGPNAASSLAAALDLDGQADDALEEADWLGFSMEAFGNLPPDAQTLLREAGRHPRCDEQVPSFLAKPPGRQGRLPDESELALLLPTLRAVVEADKKKLLQPARLEDKDGICVLEVSGDPMSPHVSVTREACEAQAAPTTIPLLPMSRDLGNLPRLKGTWLVGMPTLPAGIEGDDRSLQLLLVVDDASEYVIQGRPVFAGDLKEAADGMAEAFRGKGFGGPKGLPEEIIFSSRKLHNAMAPNLEPLGVRCIYTATIPKLSEIAAEFSRHCAGELPPFADDIEAPSPEDLKVPPDDDLAGWKEADWRLSRRFAQHFEREDRLWSSRAVKRYFGDDDLDYFFCTSTRGGP